MLKRGMPPVHPGNVLRELYLEPLGLTNGDAAANLGVTRKTLSLLLNEHQGISAEMALRLAKAFGTTPELWMNMQRDFDLWNAGKKVAITKIKAFRRVKKAPAENVVLKG
ncbi:HigA family addiction module antitoxin [Chitinophaga sancti]|uniref:Addiction module antidote protein, HigA family n=1 Tax=Chitinophaga sancti TaxID=1004 RepID=A0A1K1P0P5_9BACT|nr:HigA family addiction module antitoxin [Chitinophaga sancti]WQD60361.1 HigA family addiction module antitoxin [Chitinophaga sancti]WQG87511.1 HigA family addiction module antitoxin [Chitinophaga sancti]SFW41013.1 addiction module antidote protein, HigA family [Chitinophaga sancti]